MRMRFLDFAGSQHIRGSHFCQIKAITITWRWYCWIEMWWPAQFKPGGVSFCSGVITVLKEVIWDLLWKEVLSGRGGIWDCGIRSPVLEYWYREIALAVSTVASVHRSRFHAQKLWCYRARIGLEKERWSAIYRNKIHSSVLTSVQPPFAPLPAVWQWDYWFRKRLEWTHSAMTDHVINADSITKILGLEQLWPGAE
jgi:hypothetical protein